MNEKASHPDRWWLVAIGSSVVAVAIVFASFYLPAKWIGLLVLALCTFVLTYRLHPAMWYRRRAEVAFGVAIAASVVPGLNVFVQWKTDTIAQVIMNMGWPAIVLPWLAAMWFGWLDYLSRKQPVQPSPTSPPQRAERDGSGIHQELTGVAGGIHAETVHVTIQQTPVASRESPQPVVAPNAPATATQVDIGRILKYAPAELIGREVETKILDDAWLKARRAEAHRPHVLTFVALGGEGKTSLVAKWAAELAAQDWPGCDAVFAWSFYSQGTREQTAVSSDLFLAEALTFFGDAAMAGSAQSAFEKGRRLAQLVGERRALLILDGIEPLQHPSTTTAFKPGELKDQGIAKLLKDLAASSRGLCIVTTRIELPDLQAFKGSTLKEVPLKRLSREAGVRLLKKHGVTGSDRRNLRLHDDDAKSELVSEFEKLVEDVKGHALTLNLLGTYLRDAHAGDIRKRDLVKLEEASDEQGGHAFHVMDAYVKWLEQEGAEEAERKSATSAASASSYSKGQRALALMRLMGIFDRPATADCLAALWKAPAIPGLTEPLIGLSDAQRNLALKRLEDAKLLTVNRDASGTLVSLDAHPLIREYFAVRVRNAPCSAVGSDSATPPSQAGQRSELPSDVDSRIPHAPVAQSGADKAVSALVPRSATALQGAAHSSAWKAAHRRLYEHLCASTQEGDRPTLEALQPLYQAVAHGCQAGLQQEASGNVYSVRILRVNEYYSLRKLGAFGSDLGAIACFFETPWSRISTALPENYQAWLLNDAGSCLRALGRLTEVLEPMRVSRDLCIRQKEWKLAARRASNLSELELALGEVAGAVGDAEQSVTYADRSGDAFTRMANRTVAADALHQAGRRAEAEARFREAEQMQAESQPASPLLYSLPGFRYCDLLLAEAERASWIADCGLRIADLLPALHAVSERAAQTLPIAERNNWLLTIALDHLTLGRAALYAAILEQSAIPQSAIEPAVSGLRRAGQQDSLPLGLLTRAWQRSLTGARTGPDSAQADLDEAWEIAERGPMPLFMADIHLYRARLFFREAVYPFKNADGTARTPQQDLADARKIITKESVFTKEDGTTIRHSYLRRLPELEDAERAILGASK